MADQEKRHGERVKSKRKHLSLGALEELQSLVRVLDEHGFVRQGGLVPPEEVTSWSRVNAIISYHQTIAQGCTVDELQSLAQSMGLAHPDSMRELVKGYLHTIVERSAVIPGVRTVCPHLYEETFPQE